jgi:uncharacterized protein YbjT (DUF2867 family)
MTSAQPLPDQPVRNQSDLDRPPQVLVTGGTGKTGRRVVQRLRANSVPVRVGSRRGSPTFDWGEPATWPDVLDGISSVYVAYYPDLVMPGAVETVGAFTAAAKDAGVRRVVLLSGRGEEEAERAEAAVQESGLGWTVLRSAWLCQNFSEDYLLDPVLAGEIALPAADVSEPFVDADDVADVAVAALFDPIHNGRVYELTGPALLTFTDVAAEISGRVGRPVGYAAVTAAEFTATMVGQGFPAELVEPLAGLFARVLDGRNAYVADGVKEVLGRDPRTFARYAAAAAETGVWNPGQKGGE